MREELSQQPAAQRPINLYLYALEWLQTTEGKIVWVSLLGHLIVHALLLMCMPLAYYSELNGHDGDSYYVLSQNPIPAHPAYALMRYKRVSFSLFAWMAWPWDQHIGFAIVGIGGAALANLYFYRIASRYSSSALRLTLIFAFSPYLFAAAHVALPDPLSIAMVLAAFYYLLNDQFVELTLCSGFALLFKEVSAVSILAMAVIWGWRHGWKRAGLYLVLAGLPTLAVVIVYAIAWHDALWYLKEGRTTLVPAPLTLLQILTAPNSGLLVRVDSLINMGILALLAYALWRLRRIDATLLAFLFISIVPLLFLDERQYQSDFDMVRQYMVAAPALVAFSAAVDRLSNWVFRLFLAGMGIYALYYILSVSKFFITYKAEILNLLPFR
jgi:hypothetical protein